LKDLTTSKPSKPTVGRQINGKWSPVIGHGCQTKAQMVGWCRDQNIKAGEEIYKVIGEASRVSTKRASRRLPLTKIEQEICEITLGLRKKKSATQNTFTPTNTPEHVICRSLAGRGFMKPSGTSYYLTTAGIHALSRKRPISFGVVG
jgi:hypothetical protein